VISIIFFRGTTTIKFDALEIFLGFARKLEIRFFMNNLFYPNQDEARKTD